VSRAIRIDKSAGSPRAAIERPRTQCQVRSDPTGSKPRAPSADSNVATGRRPRCVAQCRLGWAWNWVLGRGIRGWYGLGGKALGNDFSVSVVSAGGQDFLLYNSAHIGFLETIINLSDAIGKIADGISSGAFLLAPFTGGATLRVAVAAGKIGLTADLVGGAASYFHTGDEDALGATLFFVGFSEFTNSALPVMGEAGVEVPMGLLGGFSAVALNSVGPELDPQVGNVPVGAIAGTYSTGDGGERGAFVLTPLTGT